MSIARSFGQNKLSSYEGVVNNMNDIYDDDGDDEIPEMRPDQFI